MLLILNLCRSCRYFWGKAGYILLKVLAIIDLIHQLPKAWGRHFFPIVKVNGADAHAVIEQKSFVECNYSKQLAKLT